MTQPNIGHNSGSTSFGAGEAAALLVSVVLAAATIVGPRIAIDRAIGQTVNSLSRDMGVGRIGASIPPRAPGF